MAAHGCAPPVSPPGRRCQGRRRFWPRPAEARCSSCWKGSPVPAACPGLADTASQIGSEFFIAVNKPTGWKCTRGSAESFGLGTSCACVVSPGANPAPSRVLAASGPLGRAAQGDAGAQRALSQGDGGHSPWHPAENLPEARSRARRVPGNHHALPLTAYRHQQE